MSDIDRFREVALPLYHEHLPDEVVRKTVAFQWWSFGEALRGFGRTLRDEVARVLSGETR